MQQRIRSLVHGEGEQVQPKAAARRRGSTWCEKMWGRIVLIMVRMITTVRQQLVVDSLIMDACAASSSASSTTTAPQAKDKAGKKKQTVVSQGLGTQLSRSQAQTKWTLEPEQCRHEEQDLRMRGNQAKHWWACLKCGSRWERVETDTVPGRGALPAPARPVFRSTNPPSMLPPPRSQPNLGSLTLDQARNPPSRSLAAQAATPKPSAAPLGRMTPKMKGVDAYQDLLKSIAVRENHEQMSQMGRQGAREACLLRAAAWRWQFPRAAPALWTKWM